MRRAQDKTEFDCPHCGQGYTIDIGEAVFMDDAEDEAASQCEECKGWYQLQVESAEIVMVATKAPDTIVGQMQQ